MSLWLNPRANFPLGKTPPPQYSLQLEDASVDDALLAVAEAGNVNIIADTTDWPNDNKTLTADNSDSTINWLLGISNEFSLTMNADGRDHLGQLGAYSKNYVLWREPDIEPILQQVRQTYTMPTVPNDADGNPILKPEDMESATYKRYLTNWQYEQANRQLSDWLAKQGVTKDPIRAPRDFASSQLPAPLRESVRQLARMSLTNPHGGLNYTRPDIIRKLEDEFWQKARLIYRDLPRERRSYFSIESELDGQLSEISLIGFYPDLKVGAR